MKNVTSSPHVACIFLGLFSWFLCDDHNNPRPIQFWAPIVMGNEAKMRIFLASGGASSGAPSRAGGGLFAEPRSALLASLGQYTAAVQYTDWFLPQYNRYWLSQPMPSPMICMICSTQDLASRSYYLIARIFGGFFFYVDGGGPRFGINHGPRSKCWRTFSSDAKAAQPLWPVLGPGWD